MPSPADSAPRRARRALFLHALLWLAIAAVLVAFRGVLMPFAGALLIAYLLAPLVERLSGIALGKVQLPRWGALLAVYAGFFLLVYAFFVTALPQLYHETARLTIEARTVLAKLTPERITELSGELETWLETHRIPIDLGPVDAIAPELQAPAVPGLEGAAPGPRLRLDLRGAVAEWLGGASAWAQAHFFELVGYSRLVIAKLLGSVFVFFFMLMVAAFVLIDVRGIHRFFEGLAPKELRGDYRAIVSRIDEKLAGVIRGQIVICLINGVLTLVGLLLLEVKFALILATLATVLSFIPIFGTILSTVPIVIVGLSQGFSTGLAALAWILGIHALEAYFLNPRIMGTAAKIHPALIAFALLAGERSFGFVGALFAVPTASILLATFDHVKARADELAGEADPPVPRVEPGPSAP